MQYVCCADDPRRDEIAARADLNGIDFLEVHDAASLPGNERQRTLFVHFINDPSGLTLERANVRIEGGERIPDVAVANVTIAADPRAGTSLPVLVVEVDRPGDFSIYTLRLVEDPANPNRLTTLDPLHRAVRFSFKANCDATFDCKASEPCAAPTATTGEPLRDYLARDYASLRQLILDRLAVTVPAWRERNVADLPMAIVELLAYVGDYLSYRQDAVATEAYLTTARRRVSARRHARLVDYFMHDGCNARVWVQVRVSAPVILPAQTTLLTTVPGLDPRLAPGSNAHTVAMGSGAEIFETMHAERLDPALNDLRFYTWGQRECCLPRGATHATLRGSLPLTPGAVLVFVEICSPRTGHAGDAELAHRHAVRLTTVTAATDPLGGRFEEEPHDGEIDLTEIEWSGADALPFPLCISAETITGEFEPRVSVALGNIVAADHGRTITEDVVPAVPESRSSRLAAPETRGSTAAAGNDARPGCVDDDPLDAVPPRYRPALRERPVTQEAPFSRLSPASHGMHFTPHAALPSIRLRQRPLETSRTWEPRHDLLASDADAREFVLEVEDDGTAAIRFGDDEHGSRPQEGAEFVATYRIGNGTRGNIGADAIRHIVFEDSAVEGVSNPMPGIGGTDPETIDEVRTRAPFAFRTQDRAVTPDDYARFAERQTGVQRAAATLRWTGSWHTVFVSVDRTGGERLDDEFEALLRGGLEPVRLAGHDIEIDRPRAVAIEIAMHVGVRDGYARSDIERALRRIFSRRSLFHPDNFTFGQTVFASPIYAAAQAVDGVACVELRVFQRRDRPGRDGLDLGRLEFARLEIPRLDNDPNFPERGTFVLTLAGGR